MTDHSQNQGKSKVGKDGLTKHQRYYQRHKSVVDAKNAQRNKASRLAKRENEAQASKSGGMDISPEYSIEQDKIDAATVTTLKEQVSKWTARWYTSPSDYIGDSGRIIEPIESNNNWDDIEKAGEELEETLAEALSKLEGRGREHHHLLLMYQREVVSRGLGMISIFVCNTSADNNLRYVLHRGFSQER